MELIAGYIILGVFTEITKMNHYNLLGVPNYIQISFWLALYLASSYTHAQTRIPDPNFAVAILKVCPNCIETAANNFEKTTAEGILRFELATLATISQTNSGQYKITLNQDYKWTDAQLKYRVLHQVATILGLRPNQNIVQSYLPLNPPLVLSGSELAELQVLYPASGLPSLKTEQITQNTASKKPIIEAIVSNFEAVPMVLSTGHCWSSKSPMPTLNDNTRV